jgi:nucleoid-associated protein YgaU
VTRTPQTATPVPELPSATPVAQISPSATPIAPTATVASRGVHRVRRGDTLWGIACEWYSDMPLLPGANPLTPCTCWRGIHAAGARVRPPQLIYPGERLAIPAVCGW